MLEKILEQLQENSNLQKSEKILLIVEEVLSILPLSIQLLVKTNISLVNQFLTEIEEEQLNEIIDSMIDILEEVRG